MRIPRFDVRAGAAALAAAVLVAVPIPAQQGLTVERIYGSSELEPEGLPQLEWLSDGRRFTHVQPTDDGTGTDLVVTDAATSESSVLVDGSTLVPPGHARPIAIEGYSWSPDETRLLIFTNTQRVWRQNTKGVYYVLELATGRLTPVSTGFGWQQFAKFSPDGTRVGFVRDNDLWATDLRTGEERRLTRDGSEDIINGTFDWVYEEELGLRDGWRWSPDGERIAFWRLDQRSILPFTLQDLSTLYPTEQAVRYPKAGEPNSLVRVGVVELSSGEIRWLDIGSNPDVYIARMDWAASATEVAMLRLNRHQNRLELLLADVRTGDSRVVLTETDEAWIDVEGPYHQHVVAEWLDGGGRFLWVSDRDGWDHLYLYERDGRLVRQVTRGDWEVADYHGTDESDGRVYFTATGEGPLERHVYRVALDGNGLQRLTREPGTHEASFSPTLSWFLDEHSRFGVPPTHALRRPDGEVARMLVDNARLRARLDAAGLGESEFFTLETQDGVTLNGWMIRPPGFDPGTTYPVLMYVYGGPGSQTVTDGWGGDRYLWHQLMAQRGYIVASVDNRGTGARGREFKKATYLNLGALEARDQVGAARHLASLPFTDPARIGIWGWSYGGYMTLYALGLGGEVFSAGVSVAPVTDWRLYDTIYTERYMRTPAENPEGYEGSAPVAMAEGIRSDLLLIHGSGDDNVHFQQSVRMVDALVDAGRQFDFMMYPNRTHSISGGGTRVHLFTLITDWLLEHL